MLSSRSQLQSCMVAALLKLLIRNPILVKYFG